MDIAPSRPARLAVLSGSLAALRKSVWFLDGETPGLLVHPSMDEAAFAETLPLYPYGRQFLETTRQDIRFTFERYVAPLIAAYRKASLTSLFLVVPGDNRAALPVPAFAKSAPAQAPGNAVLFPLNRERHFAGVDQAMRDETPFDDKADRLVWRGAPTGKFKGNAGAFDVGPRFHIARLAATLDRDDVDLGYTGDFEGRGLDPTADPALFEAACKAPLSIREQIANRYILCLEGNDVASGLKWALAANSVVLMPHPTFQSWACETLLHPYVHYVPVRPDLSNLLDQLEWCRQNLDRARSAARCGRRFMQPLLNPRASDSLTDNLVRMYDKRITLRSLPEYEIDALLGRYQGAD